MKRSHEGESENSEALNMKGGNVMADSRSLKKSPVANVIASTAERVKFAMIALVIWPHKWAAT